MWIMTKYGFFSIVNAWRVDKNGKPVPGELQGAEFMIRARDRMHLTKLQHNMPGVAPNTHPIIASSDTDYPFRIIIKRKELMELLMDFVSQMDYGNFKNEVTHHFAPQDPYHNFLHSVWSAGLSLQVP